MLHLKLVTFLTATLFIAVGSQEIFPSRYPPYLEGRRAFWEDKNVGSSEAREDTINYRLPNNTSPKHYEISLTTNVHKGDVNFKGVVTITIRIDQQGSKNVVVHARQLGNFTATLTDLENKNPLDLSISYAENTEFLTLTPNDNSELPQGREYNLTIKYEGKLRRDNGGFYLSSYKTSDNRTVYLATTQFESTDARHAFPCYDEPAKRATFTITINHNPTYSAISNMPIDSTKSSEGKTVFLQTPKMSTYLIAFVVSDFKNTTGTLSNLPQRVFSHPGTEGDQEFALISGLQLTARLAEYYNVPFTLPKLDQVAVPDFAAGAMENWGIATYREEYLLYNPEKSATSTQTSIANIIGHEYTHMWFGDLVTMKWWTYLWLKEGFATMFSYEAVDKAFPEWGFMQMFIVNEYQRALNYDAGSNPRPMTHYVQKPREISALYDSVSYSKAGCVLVMWQHALTDPVFRSGLHNYLTINEFTGADEDALFQAISTAAKEENLPLPDTIKVMMGSWTRQGGVPLLTIERDYKTGSVNITQTPFHNNPNITSDKLWYVPINYATANNSDFHNTTAEFFIKNNQRSIQFQAKHLSDSDWLIVNKQSTGYYRVQYDEKNWELITQALLVRPQKIHSHNRATLINDAYQLSATKRLKHSILLNLLTYLQNEDQVAPWSLAYSVLNTFNRFLSGDDQYNSFKAYIGHLVRNNYEKLGVDDIAGEQHFTKEIRTIAINLACIAGIESCLQETNQKLVKLVEDGIEIEPNLKFSIYCNGLKQANDREFNFVYNLLMASEDQALRRVLISSLGCAQNPKHIKQFIESSVSSSTTVTLRAQERTTILSAAYSRGEPGLLASIDFLSDKYMEYAALTSGFSGANPLDSDIRGISAYVVNDKQKTKLEELVQKVKNHPNITTSLEADVDSNIKANFDWLKANRDPVIDWVVNYQRSGANSIYSSLIPGIAAVCYVVLRIF